MQNSGNFLSNVLSVGAANVTHKRGLPVWLRLRGVTLMDYSVGYFVGHFLYVGSCKKDPLGVDVLFS